MSRDQRLQIHNRLFDRLWKEDPLQNAAFSFQIMHWDVKDYSDPNWRLVDYSDVREDHQGAINKSIEALSHGHGRLRYLDLATESTLEASIADVAKEMGLHIDTDEVDYITDIFSFAEITFAEVPDEPPSTMGKIWKETLGPTGIPFDPGARNELINKARENSMMARHIEKWEQFKPPGNPQFLGDA